MHTTDRELETSAGATRLGCLLGGGGLATLAALATFTALARHLLLLCIKLLHLYLKPRAV